MATTAHWSLRDEVGCEDPEIVKELVTQTGYFSNEEIQIAVELVEEALQRGELSGYHFLFACRQKRLEGYVCFGPIPATHSSWDLYWIAVHPDCQRQGLGRLLMRETERRVALQGGGRIYVDTSGRQQYTSTRKFYERCGYHLTAVLDDFFAPGDAKCIYQKIIS